jgi:L-fucose isomerase-like protein
LVKRVQEQKPDALLVIIQHMNCWGWADRLSREAGCPLIVFSPIGTSFTGHVAGISRKTGVYLVSSLEWPAVEDGLRIIRAKRQFEESRILWIHGNQRQETVLERLGTKVRAIPRDTFNQLFDRMPVGDEVKDIASGFRRGAKKVVEPNWQDSLNSARAYTAAKRLLADEKAHALSMDCLGMVSAKLIPTPPCGAWTILQDQGITAGCEADLFGATSMMLTSYLLDRPGYMNDPVAETAKNLLIVSHCTSGSRLNGFDKPKSPYILRNHSESGLGVSVQVLWPQGAPVSLIRFQSANELIIDTGTVVSNVPTPPAGGCRTSVEVRMDDIEDARDVLGFHQVVTLGNHRRMVEAFCQVMGINIVHSPRFTTHAKA